MPFTAMICPKCHNALSEYDEGKWRCVNCARKVVYEKPLAPTTINNFYGNSPSYQSAKSQEQLAYEDSIRDKVLYTPPESSSQSWNRIILVVVMVVIGLLADFVIPQYQVAQDTTKKMVIPDQPLDPKADNIRNWRHIRPGMTEDEVIILLGKPGSIHPDVCKFLSSRHDHSDGILFLHWAVFGMAGHERFSPTVVPIPESSFPTKIYHYAGNMVTFSETGFVNGWKDPGGWHVWCPYNDADGLMTLPFWEEFFNLSNHTSTHKDSSITSSIEYHSYDGQTLVPLIIKTASQAQEDQDRERDDDRAKELEQLAEKASTYLCTNPSN